MRPRPRAGHLWLIDPCSTRRCERFGSSWSRWPCRPRWPTVSAPWWWMPWPYWWRHEGADRSRGWAGRPQFASLAVAGGPGPVGGPGPAAGSERRAGGAGLGPGLAGARGFRGWAGHVAGAADAGVYDGGHGGLYR